MAEVDSYSFFVPKNWNKTAEDQLIDIMVLLQSERQWDDYDKETRDTVIGEFVRFSYSK